MTGSLKLSGFLALITIGVAILFLFDPVRTSVYPPCPFHWLTGLNCPGCGSMRALHQLVHGHLAAALGCNPLTVFLLPLLCVLLVKGGQAFVKPVWIWTLLGAIIAFGVLRNIPLHPFTLLAPQP
jgi:hypothetical protein